LTLFLPSEGFAEMKSKRNGRGGRLRKEIIISVPLDPVPAF